MGYKVLEMQEVVIFWQ